MSEKPNNTTAQQTPKGELNNSMSWESLNHTRLEAIAELQAANPHLVPGVGCVVAAKNIRKELKQAFPSVKFRVTTSKFSMGDAVRISWIDGPTVGQVDAITDKYAAGEFDSSEDIYRFSTSMHNEAFGSAKYVTTSRDFSAALISEVIAELAAEWHDGPLPTAEEYLKGQLFYVTPSRYCETWQRLITRAASSRAAGLESPTNTERS